MKSQKQRNRAPRPFKNKGNDHGWGGDGFIPVSHKPAPRVPKPKEAPSGSANAAANESPPQEK